MAFAARIVAGVADVVVALVLELEPRRGERLRQPAPHFGGDGANGGGVGTGGGGRIDHLSYIVRFEALGSQSGVEVGEMERAGRGAADRCGVAGCDLPGEFRAPLSPGGFDGPGRWHYLCLDHVRVHNSRYNYFAGMSPEEITAAQSPIAGWERETRAFATNGTDPAPAWRDFADPLDAIGRALPARDPARAVDRFTPGERRALKVMGLKDGCDRPALRQRYSQLVRLPPRPQWRRSRHGSQVARRDRGLSDAQGCRGFRLIKVLRLIPVRRAKREESAIGPRLVDRAHDDGMRQQPRR